MHVTLVAASSVVAACVCLPPGRAGLLWSGLGTSRAPLWGHGPSPQRDPSSAHPTCRCFTPSLQAAAVPAPAPVPALAPGPATRAAPAPAPSAADFPQTCAEVTSQKGKNYTQVARSDASQCCPSASTGAGASGGRNTESYSSYTYSSSTDVITLLNGVVCCYCDIKVAGVPAPKLSGSYTSGAAAAGGGPKATQVKKWETGSRNSRGQGRGACAGKLPLVSSVSKFCAS